MRVTLSVIKADVGGYVGHSSSHPMILDKARECLKEFKDKEGVDLSSDPVAAQRLKEAAEKAKIELSTTLETDINLPFITATDKGPMHFNMKLKRAQLEKLVEPIIKVYTHYVSCPELCEV